ncbi:MAG: DUF2723 domain-containing protein [Geobacteraceae bacterium]|nr:DUF2723 domain-containing protein [Geobacteraceae bacterium]
MPEKQIELERLLLPLLLFISALASRIPFTSGFLYHYDSCQFALALKKYDISLHQPHPPGYFLYVMLGRLVNLATDDANAIFVSLSVFFSALTVVAIYYLGKELYFENAALLAAALAITSPSLWFHGEVALTYALEAFFSTVIALSCWKMSRGKHGLPWLAAILMGVAGGIRQNTPVFLFPLWLYAMKDLPPRKIFASLGLFGLVSLSWFIPMVWMTGGWNQYRHAFQELWLFTAGHNSVFERGWPFFSLYASTLIHFVIYGIGLGLPILGLMAYSLMIGKKTEPSGRQRAVFFSLWILPALLFHLFIFIHPANPGYSLIFLPALVLLTAASTELLAERIKKATNKDFRVALAIGLIVSNSFIFLFLNIPVSFPEIRNHDRRISALLASCRAFDPSNTAIFARSSITFGFRHIMYYLPEYGVYLSDIRRAKTGEIGKEFWGRGRETFLAEGIVLPANITSFAALLSDDESKRVYGTKGLKVTEVAPSIHIASGPVSLLKEVYPELRLAPRPAGTH